MDQMNLNSHITSHHLNHNLDLEAIQSIDAWLKFMTIPFDQNNSV